MHHYEITTCKEADPADRNLLQRAFARAAVNWAHMVKGVEVSGPGGCFVIVMDVVGPPVGARLECERLFTAAWYDAFGSRGTSHIGWLAEEPDS